MWKANGPSSPVARNAPRTRCSRRGASSPASMRLAGCSTSRAGRLRCSAASRCLSSDCRSPFRELLADLVNGAEQMCAHRAGAQPEVFGDVLERKVLVVAQAEDHLLLRREVL